MMTWFKQQRGAMFSMDARVALVIGSILAGAVGVQIAQRIQRDRVETTERAALAIVEALDNYASATPNGPYPTEYTSGTSSFNYMILDRGGFLTTSQNLSEDAWGNNWILDSCTVNLTIEGIEVPVYYAVAYSPGPDGVFDSHTGGNDFLRNAFCQSDYAAWVAQGDDIGAKYTNLELQRNRVLEYKRRATTVVNALRAHETNRFLDNQRFCTQAASPGTNSRCNWNGGSYETGEEAQMNYYPRSTIDTTTCPTTFYFDQKLSPQPTAWSYTPAATTTLLERIGLTDEYATDPWNRRLCYNSNAAESCTSPFIATVRYASSCS